MAQKYIKNIAIVGAAGNQGKCITKELLASGKHTVTAITRIDSKSELPEGVKVAKVNYDDHNSLVEAFKGQEVLIISLSVMAPRGSQATLIETAAEAGVAWIMPNEYSPDFGDTENPQYGKDAILGPGIVEARQHIERLGVNWVGLVCSFWYPHCIAHEKTPYGFDIPNKAVTFFDDGETKVTQSTLEQAGRAVAGLFGLPIEGSSPCLNDWKNRPCYCSSFTLSQKEMFAAILAVTDSKESEWNIEYEPSTERFKRSQELLQQGDRAGVLGCMVTRVFYRDGAGDYSSLVENQKLGIAEENVEKVTRKAVEIARKGYTYDAAT